MKLKNLTNEDLIAVKTYVQTNNRVHYLSDEQLNILENKQIYMRKITHDAVRKEIHINLKPKSENQAKLLNSISESQITVVNGLAGTGKTFMSVVKALELYKSGKVDKIYLIKSVTPVKEESVGFLKGDLSEKIKPYAFSFMHCFRKIIGDKLVANLEHMNVIEFLPIAFLRGVSLEPNSIVLVDEAQNISISSLRTILTRIEEGAKIVILGDSKQIDTKSSKLSSLDIFIDNFSDFKSDEINVIKFDRCDQVRNPLINKLEDRFDELEEKNPKLFG